MKVWFFSINKRFPFLEMVDASQEMRGEKCFLAQLFACTTKKSYLCSVKKQKMIQ